MYILKPSVPISLEMVIFIKVLNILVIKPPNILSQADNTNDLDMLSIELSKKYGVKNFDELLILNEEVGAFIIDSSKLDDDELECVNKKKDDFRKRISKDRDFVLKRKDALSLQKTINDIYNNKAYEELLRTTNFKDFLEMNNYEYNPKNLDRLLYLYFDMKGNLGSCSKFTFKDRSKSLCLYRGENIVYGTKKNQNNICKKRKALIRLRQKN